jgi:hypothetical protein
LSREERRSLEHGRGALITLLAARDGRHMADLVVVFDGAERREVRSVQQGISIVFTMSDCTADDCIVRLAAEAEGRGQRVTVATDDAGIRAALSTCAPMTHVRPTAQVNQEIYGADRVRAQQFRHRSAIKQLMDDAADAEPYDPRKPKRGNSRRAPKPRR